MMYGYRRFLLNSSPSIQQLALQCLLKFNVPYLTPYKERILRLIDQQTYREEMTVFPLDRKSALIHAEHRVMFVPILLLVVFPKLVKRRVTKGPKVLGC